jgi:hypothetical protein
MSTVELTLYNFVKTEFNLSDEKAMKFVEVLEELQENKTKQLSDEYRSVFKEDLHKMEISIRTEMSSNTKWIVGLMFGLAMMIVGLYLKG